MAISELYSGTETVGTTEHSLTGDDTSLDAIATDGMVWVMLDLSALAAGDIFELKLHEKVVSGGTQRAVEVWTYAGVQGTPHPITPPVPVLHGWEFSLKKLAGTDRSITWSIRAVT